MMSTLCSRKGTNILFAKGAPEAVLEKCSNAHKRQRGRTDERSSSQRLKRCSLEIRENEFARFSISHASTPAKQTQITAEDENDLTFLGFVGIADPLRAEVARAIATCRGAGIRVVMVTGDNKTTAESIGSQIGLIEANAFGEPIVPDGASLQACGLWTQLKSDREKSWKLRRV